jgi:hypothetical protein
MKSAKVEVARHGVMERWMVVVWRIELEAPMISFPFLAVGLYQEWAENARKMAGFFEGRRRGVGVDDDSSVGT